MLRLNSLPVFLCLGENIVPAVAECFSQDYFQLFVFFAVAKASSPAVSLPSAMWGCLMMWQPAVQTPVSSEPPETVQTLQALWIMHGRTHSIASDSLWTVRSSSTSLCVKWGYFCQANTFACFEAHCFFTYSAHTQSTTRENLQGSVCIIILYVIQWSPFLLKRLWSSP